MLSLPEDEVVSKVFMVKSHQMPVAVGSELGVLELYVIECLQTCDAVDTLNDVACDRPKGDLRELSEFVDQEQ